METIEQAKDRLEITMDGKNGFYRGALWAQQWIPVEEKLPEENIAVICKVNRLSWVDNDYAIGYIKHRIGKKVWMIESKHCTHHDKPEDNCVTHWRPIELK